MEQPPSELDVLATAEDYERVACVRRPKCPEEVEEADYFAVNRDVEASGLSARDHFTRYGIDEHRVQAANVTAVRALRGRKLARVRFREEPTNGRVAGEALNFLTEALIAEFRIPENPPVSAYPYGEFLDAKSPYDGSAQRRPPTQLATILADGASPARQSSRYTRASFTREKDQKPVDAPGTSVHYMFVLHQNPTQVSASIPPSPGWLAAWAQALAAHVADQIAALEAQAARPTLFLLAFLLAPRAAARQRRILQLQETAVLIAAMAEAFAGPTPVPAPPQAAPVPAPARRVQRAPARRSAPREPNPRPTGREPRRVTTTPAHPTVRTTTPAPRPLRAPSHTLRPAARGSPAPAT